MARRNLAWIVLFLAAIVGIVVAILHKPFPGDRVPEGAYARIAKSVAEDDPKAFFAYLETEAQWACYSIRDARREASEKIRASYPEQARSELLGAYERVGALADGSDVFALLYRDKNFGKRLRKDMSGVVSVEVQGERASVVTARGTRWPFRRRDNGIWGLTVFTAELLAEREKAARDLELVKATASDYDRARGEAKGTTAGGLAIP